VTAKGANIPLPVPASLSEYFDQDTEVTIQLINNETPLCWTSSFTAAAKNEVGQFKAKTP
jgi:hypothetical protein